MTKEQAEKKAIETSELNGGRPFKAVQVTYPNGERGWDVTPDSGKEAGNSMSGRVEAGEAMKPEYQYGDQVVSVEFMDCFGVFHPEVPGLTVTDIKLVKGESIPDYYRLTARGKNGETVEGAARSFRRAKPEERTCSSCGRHATEPNVYLVDYPVSILRYSLDHRGMMPWREGVQTLCTHCA